MCVTDVVCSGYVARTQERDQLETHTREGCDRRENNILGCDRYSVIVCSVHYKISVKEAASPHHP